MLGDKGEGELGMRLQCSKCFEKVKRVYVEDTEKPISDVFYCDKHGMLPMYDMELVEE